MDIDPYLERIHYDGMVSPTHDVLCELQRAHMLSVPFENLDIVPLHRPIRLDELALWDKLVTRKRGGYCYELNGMFAWLLRQIGYQVTYLNARVIGRDGGLGPDFDHLALLVRSLQEAGTWLADVGFGDSFVEPLELREGEQTEGLRAYRLEKTGPGYMTWQRDYGGNWKRMYFFDLAPHDFPAEYEAANRYQQEAPESHFTRQSIISRLTGDGRITLEADRLITTDGGKREERPVTPEEWPRLLREHFGVVL